MSTRSKDFWWTLHRIRSVEHETCSLLPINYVPYKAKPTFKYPARGLFTVESHQYLIS